MSILEAIWNVVFGFIQDVFRSPTPAYWIVAILLSLGVGLYVALLTLRKEESSKRIEGGIIAGIVLLLLLMVLAAVFTPRPGLNDPAPKVDVGAQWPILSLVTFLPLLGAIIVLCMPKDKPDWVRWTALLVTFFPLGLATYMWIALGKLGGGMQFLEQAEWISQISVVFRMGVDGISVPMVFLTALLSSLAILYSFIIEDRPKEYFAFFLLLEMAMSGVFVSLNIFLFYIFWELSLVPMYFLIGLWGAPPRQEGKMVRGGPYAAMKFFLYTLVGSVGLLLGILAIYFNTVGKIPLQLGPDAPMRFGNLDIVELTNWVANGNNIFQTGTVAAALAFWAVFVGFAIKVPSFPFHTWLPDAHVEAPTAGSVILAGILLKLGAYGLIRFLLPLFPAEFQKFAPIIIILATISIVYGALVAMAQWDLKKLIAYSSVNHMGYVTLGVAIAGMTLADPGLRAIALNGAVLQMFNHGIITGALFFLVGVIYERVHTRDLHVYGGLRRLIPVFAGVWGITMFASLGLPGLAGFVSEFMVFGGSWSSMIDLVNKQRAGALSIPVMLGAGTNLVLIAVATLGMVFGAAFILWTIQRTLFGTAKEKFTELHEEGHLFDMSARELVTLVPLLGFMIAIGVYPGFIVNTINQAVTALLR